MNSFHQGYENFQKNSSAYSIYMSDEYISKINKEINKLTADLNNFKNFKTDTLQLKGDIAEFWHSGTHNIDAAVKDVHTKTFVDRSHDFASVDIKSNFGKDYGLKYYSNAENSIKAQSVSYFETYKSKYNGVENPISFEEFLKKIGVSESDVLKHDPIYNGQVRIIPSDQLKEAVEFLRRKIDEEAIKRPELVYKYQETLTNLADKIKSCEGSESIPLSKENATRLAELAKEGDFDPTKEGLTTEELVRFQNIMEQSLKAGLTAGAISMVLKIAPELYKTISMIIRNENIDKEQFQKIGFAAMQGGAEGFVRGSIAAGLTTVCKSGMLGEAFKSLDPTMIGAFTVIAMNTMQNSYKLSTNKISKGEFVNRCMRDLFVTTSSLMLGGIVQSTIPIPVISYLLGSFVGSIAASFVYDTGYRTFLSFCVDTGFTFFGIVEQDYELSKEILESIGVDVFEYERFEFDRFAYDKIEFDRFQLDEFKYDQIEIIFLRRGVIGVNKIGYIA